MTERQEVLETSVPSLPRGVKLRFDKARDTWVLLAPERVFMPDQIAVEILKRCDGKAALSDIIDDLVNTFSAPRDQVAADVKAMLQDLADKGNDRGLALCAINEVQRRKTQKHLISASICARFNLSTASFANFVSRNRAIFSPPPRTWRIDMKVSASA